MKLTYRLFIAFALCSASFVGCSSSPSSGDGERAIQSRIKEQSEGRIKLTKFEKSNGSQGEVMGFKIYNLEFAAEIEFTEDSKWITGMSQELSFQTSKPIPQPQSGFSWNSFLDTTTNPGTLVKQGQRVNLSGVIRFVKKERGWAVDGMQLTKMDVGSPQQSATAATKRKLSPAESSARCAKHMEYIATAFVMWAPFWWTNNPFPFNVSTNAGGTLELCMPGSDGFDRNAVFHFQAIPLVTPQVLVCPADSKRRPVRNLKDLRPENVSYQLRTGPKITRNNPGEILAVCPIHHHVLMCDFSVRTNADVGSAPQSATGATRSVDAPAERAAECISILRMIDGAKKQWALDTKAQDTDTPTEKQILPHFNLSRLCQGGGVYTINAIGEKPTCSIPGHQLPTE